MQELAAETTAKGPDLLVTCGRVGIKKLQSLCRTGLFQLSYITFLQDILSLGKVPLRTRRQESEFDVSRAHHRSVTILDLLVQFKMS